MCAKKGCYSETSHLYDCGFSTGKKYCLYVWDILFDVPVEVSIREEFVNFGKFWSLTRNPLKFGG